MRRSHRIPGVGQLPRTKLGRQLAEPGRQHRGILGGELPDHPGLGPVAMGILHGHAGLPGAAQPAQGDGSRPGASAG